LTAGSSIQVAGSAQMLHKKQDHMTGFQTCFSNHCLSIIIIAPFITTIFICEAPVMLLAATFLLLTSIIIPWFKLWPMTWTRLFKCCPHNPSFFLH
jgi:hypothetical protein